MWIVRLALRRPYTIAVMCFLLLIMGVLAIQKMLVDVFPSIDIPVVGVIWNYPGLSAEDMERRVVLLDERAISTTVGGVEKIESQSTAGIGLLKIYFQAGTDIGGAIAQISSIGGTVLRSMPPGMQPPLVIQFNASNLPVSQLTLSSKTMPEEQIFDYALNFIRIKLFTIPGLSTPAPYGGKSRLVTVDIDPAKMQSKGLSATDISTALQNSNVIIPAGTARIGSVEYTISTNGSPSTIDQFNGLPVKVVNGRMVQLGDVAHIQDGFADQTNIVRVNGQRATYLTILKKSDASTLAVVEAMRDVLPQIKAAAPGGLEMSIDFDQSVFVRAAISSVVREAITASILVSLLILLFLGSWRSMVIVSTSIPLSIIASIIVLKVTGNSLNIMTLGGLSLAVGMLVDDATVAVENIHRNRTLGKTLTVAILHGSQQIAIPAIMATMAICIVFFPVVLLTGPARFLFTPMALAVVVAMMASYVLSRTLVPTLMRLLMPGERLHEDASGHAEESDTHNHKPQKPPGPIGRFSIRFNRKRDEIFARFQESYVRLLESMLHHRPYVLAVAGLVLIITFFLPSIIGTDFFPSTDTGLMKLHLRAPTGTRIEETEKLVINVENTIRRQIPAEEVQTVNENIGVPTFFNLAFVGTDNTSSMDAEFLIELKPDHHPTVQYMNKIRKALATEYPGVSFYFQPADIVNQVLNFGLSAPIDVQVEFSKLDTAFLFARRIRDAMKEVAGTQDVSIKQVLDYPTLKLSVDRARASQVGLSERDVANSMLISLSSSSLVAPSYFLNPVNNVNYTVVVKTPMDKVKSIDDLLNTPITPPSSSALLQTTGAAAPTDVPSAPAQTIGNLATLSTTSTPNQIDHSTVQRVMDITANVEGRDLGSVAAGIQQKIDSFGKLPAAMKITVKGQNQVRAQSFNTMGLGILLAIALVYLLMVVLFQSWLDPFIIMIAVPGALVGILWMLAITGTTINVVSLMGSIMAVGIAVSNSILLVNYANDVRVEERLDAFHAALEAGKTRLRPVLMTAIAMILGMIPMAIGTGEGGEQNAPLGRAVIGGLLCATVVTLFIVPIIYSLLRTKPPSKHVLETRFLAEEQGLVYDEETGVAEVSDSLAPLMQA